MHAVPDRRLFSTVDAVELGWSRSALVRAARDGRLTRVRRSQYSPAVATAMVRAVAAARVCSGSVISHRSAAVLHGIPLLGSLDFRPDLTLSPAGTGDTVDALVHRATMRPTDVVVIGDGLMVTSPARTVVDLARSRSVDAAVVALDHALHAGLTTRERVGRCRRQLPTLARDPQGVAWRSRWPMRAASHRWNPSAAWRSDGWDSRLPSRR